MFHELIRTWFEWLQVGGYAGIVVLMAMESSIIPVPSEIVMAPAAFWAAQGRMSFVGVIIAGTVGSYIGSVLSYWFAGACSRLVPARKLEMGREWLLRFGTFGVFTARFLPVVRHLVSIPAGLFKMPFGRFSLATIVGSGLWCWILAWFGQEVLGQHPELLESPEKMIVMIQSQMHWFLGAAIGLAVLYGVMVWFRVKKSD